MVHRHTANFLSLTRIPCSIVLLLTYEPDSLSQAAFATFLSLTVIATDVLDGKIARKFKIESKLGYLLDGLGDRAFHTTAYLVLFSVGILPPLLAWLLIFREISQYAVRLVETDWHDRQSKLDRLIAKLYTAIVHCILLVSYWIFQFPSTEIQHQFPIVANVILLMIGLTSYSRIVPRLWCHWVNATHD